MLNKINDILKYFEVLEDIKKQYVICIAMQGDWKKEMNDSLSDRLQNLLNSKIDFNRETNFSYCAIICDESCIENVSDKKYAKCSSICNKNTVSCEISVISSYQLQGNSHIEPGITVDGKRYGFFVRGINIVVCDIVSKQLIDSVAFDTARTDYKAVHVFEKAAQMSDMLTELYGGFGYTIAQLLYDSGVTSLYVYAEPGFEDLVRTALLPLVLHRKIHIMKYFSTYEYTLKFVYDGAFPRQKFEEFGIDKIQKGIPVLILTPFCNSKIKPAVKQLGNKLYEIGNLLPKAANYIKNEQIVLQKLSETPGVIAVSYSKPRKETCYDTNGHKRMLKEGDSTDKIFNALRNGLGYPYVSKAIVEADHTIDEWAELMCRPIPEQYVDENGYVKFYDKSGRYVNIHDGHREVEYKPDNAENTIYIFGDCNTFGIYNSDAETYASQLQKMLNESGYRYLVKNYGWFLFNYQIKSASIIAQIFPRKGDIIVFEGESSGVFDFPHLSLKNEILPKDLGEMFYDSAHYTPNMHKWMAGKFYDFFVENDFFKDFPENIEYKTFNIPLSGFCPVQGLDNKKNILTQGIEEFKKNLLEYRVPIGAIVMNCNPFTKGHRYLIEQASHQVDKLFVFVVEEDKSCFTFQERYELVQQETRDLPNVTVLPSGNFMISSLTFSEYFNKSEIQDRRIDPSNDVEIFCRHIAPFMGINIRFAGEEPLDNVTRQYNETMKRILPDYGIIFREIPRKEIDNEVISASRVRKAIEDKDWRSVERLVPETTLSYLRNKYR